MFAISSEYHDYADQDLQWVLQNNVHLRRRHARGRELFPSKLHLLLEHWSASIHCNVIQWLPHGRAFRFDKAALGQIVLPQYLAGQTKIASFQRQLNMYGFLKLTGDFNADKGAYYHALFLRGRPDLAKLIGRGDKVGCNVRQRLDPESEPNFSRMAPVLAMGGNDDSSTFPLHSTQHTRASNGGGELRDLLWQKFPSQCEVPFPPPPSNQLSQPLDVGSLITDSTMAQSMWCCDVSSTQACSESQQAQYPPEYWTAPRSLAPPTADLPSTHFNTTQSMEKYTHPQQQGWHCRTDTSVLSKSHQDANPLMIDESRLNVLDGPAWTRHESFQKMMRIGTFGAPLNDSGRDTFTSYLCNFDEESSDCGDLSYECGSLCGNESC
jgi:HSF-type DNA-binding